MPPPPRARTKSARTATPCTYQRAAPLRHTGGAEDTGEGITPRVGRGWPRAVVARYVKSASVRVVARRARGRSVRGRARSATQLCNAPPPSPGRKIERGAAGARSRGAARERARRSDAARHSIESHRTVSLTR